MPILGEFKPLATMKVLAFIIIACSLPRQCTGHPWGSQFSLRKTRRAHRSLAELNAGVICSLDSSEADNDPSVDLETHTINFYYALGTVNSTTLDATDMFELQQNMFHAVEQSIAWCYEESDATESRRFLQQQRRNLGIVAVSVGPTEFNVGNSTTSDNVTILMDETGADRCQLNKGSVRVLLHEGNTIEYMSSVLLDSMRLALNDDHVWQDWKMEVKDLAFLSYLGASLEEVYGAGSGAAAVGAAGGGGVGLLLGIGIPIILLLLLLGFAKSSRNREHATERQLNNHMMKSDFVLAGTADPPQSFHEGLYHYMLDGTRYLSTNCEGCLETRRNSFFTDENLGTIMEGTEFEEHVLVTADSKNLGKRTSNMNVHKCTSSICQRCLSVAAPGSQFVPAHGDASNLSEV